MNVLFLQHSLHGVLSCICFTGGGQRIDCVQETEDEQKHPPITFSGQPLLLRTKKGCHLLLTHLITASCDFAMLKEVTTLEQIILILILIYLLINSKQGQPEGRASKLTHWRAPLGSDAEMRKAIDTICGTICICHSEFEKREKLVLSFEKIIKIEI